MPGIARLLSTTCNEGHPSGSAVSAARWEQFRQAGLSPVTLRAWVGGAAVRRLSVRYVLLTIRSCRDPSGTSAQVGPSWRHHCIAIQSHFNCGYSQDGQAQLLHMYYSTTPLRGVHPKGAVWIHLPGAPSQTQLALPVRGGLTSSHNNSTDHQSNQQTRQLAASIIRTQQPSSQSAVHNNQLLRGRLARGL